ncbi:40S ribosomal protein S30-B isoform B, partial [Parastagonospora nodorum SN15]
HRHHRPPPQSKNPSTTLQTHQTHPPQSWVRFTDPSLVPERSSLRLPR